MQYVTTETQNMAQFNVGMSLGNLAWQPTLAKTEASAKRVAQRNRTFQGTYAHVAFVTSTGKIVPVAHRVPGGIWFDSAE